MMLKKVMKQRILIVAIMLCLLVGGASAYWPSNWFDANPANNKGDIYSNESVALLPNTTVCAQYPFGVPTAGSYSLYNYIYRGSSASSNVSMWGSNYTYVDITSSSASIFNVGTLPYGREGVWVSQIVMCSYNGTDLQIPGNWYTMRNLTRPPANVTFHASETGNFTNKLAGVYINVSSGQTGTTDVNGTVTITVTPPSHDYTYNASLTGYTSVGGALGNIGFDGGDIYFTMSPGFDASNASLYLEIRSTVGGSLISNSQYGLKNMTSGVWKNGTTPSGIVGFMSTDGTPGYPISIGQSLYVAGAAEGYTPDSALITIPPLPIPFTKALYLMPNSSFPRNGTWSCLVTLLDYTNNDPVLNADVKLYTGINTNIPFTAEELAGDNGVYAFINISTSTIGRLTATQLYYNDAEEIINIVPNTTQHKTIYMIRKGTLPNVTPTATPGGVPTTSPTGVPTTSPGDTPSEKAYFAFELLIEHLYDIMMIVVGCIFIWLMWEVVYLITGGRIIDKIMRRGRGGGRGR